jgi:hypothetical protein
MQLEDLAQIKQSPAEEKVGAAFFKAAYEGQPYIGNDQTGIRATGDANPQEFPTGLWATGDALYGGNQTLLQRQPNNWPTPLG